MTILELMEKRAGLAGQAREILEEAEREKREMTADEVFRWDTLMDEVTGLKEQIDRLERQQAVEAELARSRGRQVSGEQPGSRTDGKTEMPVFVSRSLRSVNAGDLQTFARRMGPQYGQAFRSFLRGGFNELAPDERRALQADSDIAGGYLYAPLQFVDRLIKAVDDAVFIRQWASVFPVMGAESLGVPTLAADPADADWTTELVTGSEDSTMSFGKRELHPHPLAKRIKISRKLLRKAPDAESLVNDRLAYKFGITWEKAGLTGSGVGQPLGVFTASSDGISTSRDVSTDNTTTAITFDNLINVKFTLKGQYWPRARWLFHRDAVKMIAKLKDGDGQYLWRESVRVGEPDRVLGLPVFTSEYAPNTFTTGLYVGILGDFSNYWIADSLSFELQRLVELYAESNQVGLIGRLESDGMPVLEEAFVRVTLA